MGLGAVDEQRAHFAEGAQLGSVAEPAAGVGFGRGRGVGDALLRDVGEAGIAEQGGPLFGGEKVHGNVRGFRPIGGSGDFRGSS